MGLSNRGLEIEGEDVFLNVLVVGFLEIKEEGEKYELEEFDSCFFVILLG